MYTVYRLNTDELSAELLESIRILFPHKSIEIAVAEAATDDLDETAYLLRNPQGAARLMDAVAELRQGGGMVRELVDAD